jgi:hypothetical protein
MRPAIGRTKRLADPLAGVHRENNPLKIASNLFHTGMVSFPGERRQAAGLGRSLLADWLRIATGRRPLKDIPARRWTKHFREELT